MTHKTNNQISAIIGIYTTAKNDLNGNDTQKKLQVRRSLTEAAPHDRSRGSMFFLSSGFFSRQLQRNWK
jgi:hypothetical protein